MAAGARLSPRDHLGQRPCGNRRGPIGIWGSSYSGGHVLVVGAIDRRVKCVVSQVPLISGYHNFRRLVRADIFAGLGRQFDADREGRFDGEAPS